VRNGGDEVVFEAHQLCGALGVVTIETPRPSLHLELPDERTHQERGRQRRDDQGEPRLGVRYACGASLVLDLCVDAGFQVCQLTLDLPLQCGGNEAAVTGRLSERS
jgi:hypothetical protein